MRKIIVPTSLPKIILVLLVGLFTISGLNVKQDDAYIFYTYANNLTDGDGYVFNEGERVNATTSPLYTIALSTIYAIFSFIPGLSVPLIGYIVTFLGLLTTTLFTEKCLRIEGHDYSSILFPVIWLSNSTLRNGIGMESFLTLGLTFACLYYYLLNRLVIASLLGAFSILSRPDSLIFLGILAFDFLIRKKRISPTAFFGISVVFPWLIFSQAYFGSILPSTLSAKLSQTQTGFWGDGLIFLIGIYNALPSISGSMMHTYNLLVNIIAFLSGAIIVLINIKRIRSRVIFILFAWLFVYTISYGFILNPPAYPWYYIPISIGPAILIALALEICIQRIQEKYRSFFFNLAFTGISLFVVILFMDLSRMPVTSNYRLYSQVANWLNTYAPEDSNLGSNEIGVLGYYYDRGPVIDGLGLVTPSVVESVEKNDFSWYVREYKPDYVLIHDPSWIPIESFSQEQWFKETYEPVKKFYEGDMAAIIYQPKSN